MPKTARPVIPVPVPVLLLVLVLFSSCMSPSPRKTSGPPPPAPRPETVTKAVRKPAASVSRAERVLAPASAPAREFLLELRTRILRHDWSWVSEHSEKSHYQRFVRKRGKRDKDYTAEVFRLGLSYRKAESNLIPEPKQLDLDSVTLMEFSDYRKEKFTSVVKGFLANDEGVHIDFTLNLLDELEEVLLSGD